MTKALPALLALLAAIGAAAPVFAHADHPPAPHDLWTTWTFDPWALVPMALTAAAYACGVHRMWRRAGLGCGIRIWQAASFAAGYVFLLVALVSPLDGLGEALFSAHMAQHVVLMTLAAPLIILGLPLPAMLLGLPPSWRHRLLVLGRSAPWRSAWSFLGLPFVAAFLQLAVLWSWHAPALFQATLASDLVHGVMHASMLGAALLFWWAALPLGRRRRPAFLSAAFSIAVTLKLSGLLGALLSFAGTPLYPAYEGHSEAWGLTLLEDQQLAGLIMWVSGGPIYIVACIALMALWFRTLEARPSTSLSGIPAP
ncbi:MAG TPA: cytochrome c oxidase assembly protein [Alphaproteobacteria bacterium]|nr:cytochrome c oxidase assembly protein [Alphaproteobacteria bacterium]